MTYVSGPADEPIGGTHEEAAAKQLTSVVRVPSLGDVVMRTHRGYPIRRLEWNQPPRVTLLRSAGEVLHDGGTVDIGWLAAQLWDLADLLEAVGGE